MYHFIVNMKSGKTGIYTVWDSMERVLVSNQITFKVYFTEYPGHATDLAAEITSGQNSAYRLITVGGDGTVNEVINGIRDFRFLEFGFIQTGSGNDLARGLGLKGSPSSILEQLIHSEKTLPMDLGTIEMEERRQGYFAISSGAGMDALVCKKVMESRIKNFLNRISLGSQIYLIYTILSLVAMPKTNARIRFDDQQDRTYNGMIFAAVMNHPSEGGGIPFAPDANAFDGRLAVCIAYGIPKWKALFLLPFLAAGKHASKKGFEIHTCQSCEIATQILTDLHTDGEYIGMAGKIRYGIQEGILNVILPRE